ncbi:MAG: biopolymer transporter ExbD [Steroidobacteraceae bacterium]
MNFKPRRHEEPEINLVSLIDVVLMLVIFFMLSSSFVGEGRMRVHLPQASTTPVASDASEPIVVAVTQQGSYRVNDRELLNARRETLRAALQKVAGTDRSMNVTLRADGRATHQSVVTAMDVLGRMGFSELNVATVDESASATP